VFLTSLYIVVWSARNRVRVRLRRLREPRYLIGAFVGAAYLFSTLLARMGGPPAMPGGRRRRTPDVLSLGSQGLGIGLASVAVLIFAALAWVLPPSKRVLDFTAAETDFLFPAPVSRRWLIVHRLMRSQVGLLFASLIWALFIPSASVAGRARVAVSMWVLFATMRLYLTGIALARPRLLSPSARARRVAWAPIAALVALAGIVVGALAWRVWQRPEADLMNLVRRLDAAASTGILGALLWPFRTIFQPVLTTSPGMYLLALAGALVVLGVCLAWVLLSDETFEQVASEGAERPVGKGDVRRAPIRARDVAWKLAPSGRLEAVFAWKSAMQIGRSGDVLIGRWIVGLFTAGVLVTAGVAAVSQLHGFAAVASGIAIMWAGMTVLFGPQSVRADLRDDLANLDVIKTWPVPSSSVVRGELVWPVSFVTMVSWAAIATAFLFSGTGNPQVSFKWRFAAAVSAAIVSPGLIAAQYLVHNAAALLFPAWVPLGNQRPRGLDAMGQRLVLLAAIALSLVLVALPGALGGGLVWFVIGWLLNAPAAGLVPAAAAFTAIVLVEVLLATELLAPAYDRLDIMSVERVE
jgi:hypothetical protein